MRRSMVILGALLALQVVLAVSLNLGRDSYRAFEPEEKLLALDAGRVDGIRIVAGDGGEVLLEKRDGQWRLPGLSGFPADQAAAERLVERLTALDKGWPVATTGSASRRFKVADGAFERKLTLAKGDETLAVLFVGTSPGFRKVHVRVPGEESIYAVEFSAFEANAEADDWIDKGVLSQPSDDIQRVDLPGLSLSREDGRLVVTELMEGEETIEDEARRLLDRIAGLRVRSVLGTEQKPEYRQDQPLLRYSVALESGVQREYVVSKPEDADYYVLKASQRDEYFKMDTWAVDPLREVLRTTLVRQTAADTASAKENPTGEAVKESPAEPGAGAS